MENNPKLADQPEIEAALRLVIGNILFKLGDPKSAERHLRLAVTLSKRAASGD